MSPTEQRRGLNALKSLCDGDMRMYIQRQHPTSGLSASIAARRDGRSAHEATTSLGARWRAPFSKAFPNEQIVIA